VVTARSTRPSVASPSPAFVCHPETQTYITRNAAKAKPTAKRSAASNATSHAATGTSSSRAPRPANGFPLHQLLDIGAAEAAALCIDADGGRCAPQTHGGGATTVMSCLSASRPRKAAASSSEVARPVRARVRGGTPRSLRARAASGRRRVRRSGSRTYAAGRVLRPCTSRRRARPPRPRARARSVPEARRTPLPYAREGAPGCHRHADLRATPTVRRGPRLGVQIGHLEPEQLDALRPRRHPPTLSSEGNLAATTPGTPLTGETPVCAWAP
jgi:hypothetical protein